MILENNRYIGMKQMITSLQNNRVKEWKKLQKKKERWSRLQFLIEGYHLVEEAHKSDWNILEIIVQKDVPYPDWYEQYPIYTCTENVMKSLAETDTPQGIMAVVTIKQEVQTVGRYYLLLDAVQDPGNVGTMIRTADAAGFSAVIIGKGTVDIFNPKTIRASQGSLFHIPVLQKDLRTQIKELKQQGVTVLSSAILNAIPYTEIKKYDKVAIIIGNEGSGIRKELLDISDKTVQIPIYGKAESLNASVAAGILMYYIRS